MSAFSDALGLAIEAALRTATLPGGQPDPADYTFPEDLETFKADLAAWGILAGQAQWKAGAAAMIPYLGGLYAPVADPVVVGSTVTSFTVASGESLDTDEEWLILARLKLATGTSHNVRLGPGGTFVDASNHGGRLVTNGANEAVGPGELYLTGASSTITGADIDIKIAKRSGDPARFRSDALGYNSGPGASVYDAGGVDLATADLARVDIGSTASNRILAGSEAQLFRRIN